MITDVDRKLLIKLRIQHIKGTMKMQKDPQGHIQRTGSQNRRQPLLLALAIMLLAANSAKATIMVNASEVGDGVIFTLSGSVDLASLTYAGLGFTHGLLPGISPTDSTISFGTIEPDAYYVSDLVSPAGNSFGPGGQAIPSSVTGTSLFSLFFGPLGPVLCFSAGIPPSDLNGMMTFDSVSFSSLGLDAGMYEWTWSLGGVSDNLILSIGQPVPDTGSTLALLVLGLGGVLAVHRWRSLAP